MENQLIIAAVPPSARTQHPTPNATPNPTPNSIIHPMTEFPTNAQEELALKMFRAIRARAMIFYGAITDGDWFENNHWPETSFSVEIYLNTEDSSALNVLRHGAQATFCLLLNHQWDLCFKFSDNLFDIIHAQDEDLLRGCQESRSYRISQSIPRKIKKPYTFVILDHTDTASGERAMKIFELIIHVVLR
jgi:hypothetical protein